jgi:uncharacterized membrane protein YkvA (DUF1232 family)
MKWKSLAAWAARLRGEVLVLWHAARDPDCPPRLRWLALALAAYALSPIDLIPDFIPVLGWLDELVILPLGLAFILKRLPEPVLARARLRVASAAPGLAQVERLGRWWRRGLALLLAVWLLLAAAVVALFVYALS